MLCQNGISNFPEQCLEVVLHFGYMGGNIPPTALPVSGEAGQLSILSCQDEEIQLLLLGSSKENHLFVHIIPSKVKYFISRTCNSM